MSRVKLPFDPELIEMHGFTKDASQFKVLNNKNNLKKYDENSQPIYKLKI
jgi:hypothetical protein